MSSKLKWLAQDMKSTAIRAGRCRRELARGLVLELATEIEAQVEAPISELSFSDLGSPAPVWWVLKLSRAISEPSSQEIKIILWAFGISAEVEAQVTAEGVILRWPMN